MHFGEFDLNHDDLTTLFFEMERMDENELYSALGIAATKGSLGPLLLATHRNADEHGLTGNCLTGKNWSADLNRFGLPFKRHRPTSCRSASQLPKSFQLFLQAFR